MEIEKVRKKQRLEKKTLAFLASFLQWNNLVKRIFRGREWGKRHLLGWGDFEVHFNDWRKGNLFGECVPTKALAKHFFPSLLLDVRSYEGEKNTERWKNGTSFWLNPSYFMLFYLSHHWIVWYYKNVQLIVAGFFQRSRTMLKHLAQISQNHKNDIDMHQQKTGKKNPKTQTGTGWCQKTQVSYHFSHPPLTQFCYDSSG